MAKKHKHPLVQGFLEGERILDFLDARPELDDPASRGVRVLVEATHLKRQANEALELIESIDLTGADPDALVLVYFYWAMVSIRERRLTEFSALTSRGFSLLTSQSPPELKAALYKAQSNYAESVGDRAGAVDKMKALLDLLPDSSKRKVSHAFNHALALAQEGRLSEAAQWVKWLEKIKDPRFVEAELSMISFAQAIEGGDIEAAQALAAKIHATPKGWHKTPWKEQTFLRLEVLLKNIEVLYFEHQWRRAGKPLAAEFPHGSSKDIAVGHVRTTWENNGQIVTLLAQRKYPEALEACRADIKTNRGFYIHHYNFFAYNLIRAELCMAHPGAARRVLSLREESGNRHYLDDFFWARVHVLSDEPQKAAEAFARVQAACKKYKAEGRLDLELRWAPEISPRMLMQWGGVKEAKPKPKASPKAAPAKPAARTFSNYLETHVLGQSEGVKRVKKAISDFAPVEVSVLVTGETGTGKEVVARSLHEESPRKKDPFVAINCSAISENLLESELFGHAQGAFTGAATQHKGVFEQAGRGTLFMDEIGDISPRLQAALLRVLEGNEIRAVGSEKTTKVNCRVVFATNAPLEQNVEEGTFRKDLFYRIKRLEIQLPPLRDRGQDILLLARHFLNADRAGGEPVEITPKLAQALMAYHWPGNVRELKNEMDRMRLLQSDKNVFELVDLDERISRNTPTDRLAQTFAEPSMSLHLGPDEDGIGLAYGEPQSAEPAAARVPVFRRKDALKELFTQHKKFSRRELAEQMGVSRKTMTKDLQELVAEGFIEKREPSPSPRTHYFVLKES